MFFLIKVPQLRTWLFNAAVGTMVLTYARNVVGEPKAPQADVKQDLASEPLISIDFPEPIDLKDLISVISQWTNKNVVIDARANGKIQILAPRKVTRKEAYEAFLSAVDSLNLTVLETGHIIKILPKREAMNATPPLVDANRVNYSDRVYTQIFPLKYAGAENARNTIGKLIASTSLVAYQPTNVLILTETGFNLKRVSEFLSIIDRAAGDDLNYEFVRLKNVQADTIAKQATTLFQGKGRNGETLKLIVDTPSNTIIVAGPKGSIANIRQYCEMLDRTPTFGGVSESSIYVRPLSFADAKKVATVLQTISPTTKNRPNEKEDKLQVTADEPTNSLLISGSAAAYKSISPIIRRLDRERPQVFIDVDVISISEINNFNFLPSLLGGFSQANGQGTKTIVGYEAAKMAPLIVAQANSGAVADNAKAITGGFADSLTIGTFPGAKVNIPGIGEITPGALLTILKTDSHGKSISSPKLLTTNNEEANFLVGQTYLYHMAIGDTYGNIAQKTEKESTELSMKLKPSLSTSEYLNLEIELNANTIANFTEDGIPIIAKKKARQLVNLKNGQTILISGIRNLSRSTSEKTVPFIGSIPVIGWLFNSRQTQNSGDYVLVFLTTHIIRGANDLQAVYDKRFKESDPRRPRMALDSEDGDQKDTGTK